MTGKWTYLLFLLLLMAICTVDGKRGSSSSSSWGRRGSSRGKASSTSSTSSGGWFSWGKSTSTSHGASAPPAPKPAAAPAPSYGWTNPGYKPVQPAPKPSPGWQSPGFQPAPKPAVGSPSYGWTVPNSKPAATNTGFAKPAATNPGASIPNKATVNSNQPSSNIGPGGYPVQGGIQKSPAPNANPPPYSPTNPHGTSYSQGNTRVAPPSYSASNPHGGGPPAYSPAGGTSYNGPKKQVINNHYHYGNSPPAYSPSHYGMSSGYYPSQNSFGYPGGNYGNNRPSYGGMGLFSSGSSGFGYPGSGSWGGHNSYGSSGSGSMVKGLLIGAAGGYLANSLIRSVTNPWGYSGSGYGHGYTDRYRYDDRRYPTPPPPAATPVPDPTNNWINCVAFDPVTKSTLINPNCTCSVTVVTDPATGQNTSHHDCTPYSQGASPPMIPQQPLPVYGVNNPPPTFNGNLYGSDANYGGAAYGGGYPAGPPIATEGVVAGAAVAQAVAPVVGPPEAVPPVSPSTEGGTSSVPPQTEGDSSTTQAPLSGSLVSGDVREKRVEFYSQLEKIVNMGRFVR